MAVKLPTLVRIPCEDGAEYDLFATGDMPLDEAISIIDEILERAYVDEDFPPDFLEWLDNELRTKGLTRVEIATANGTW